jgi:Acyclic terpene utilisation family protein AtuA
VLSQGWRSEVPFHHHQQRKLGTQYPSSIPPLYSQSSRITAPAGYQAEYHIYLVGLDIEEKARWTEEQIRESIGEERLKKFSMLKFHVNGSSPIDARNQDVATVDFRVFAQSSDRDLLRMTNPYGFFRLSMVTFLEGVPVGQSQPLMEG